MTAWETARQLMRQHADAGLIVAYPARYVGPEMVARGLDAARVDGGGHRG